jgi:hypothetical protein
MTRISDVPLELLYMAGKPLAARTMSNHLNMNNTFQNDYFKTRYFEGNVLNNNKK